MKHLKQFEGFYYGTKSFVDSLLEQWNVNQEDLEDIFIWFSDMGYKVQIRQNITTMGKCLWVVIDNITDLYNTELMEETRKVIRGLTKLGLYSDSPIRFEESGIMKFAVRKI